MKNWGNFTGRITASFSAALAESRPDTSSHCRRSKRGKRGKMRFDCPPKDWLPACLSRRLDRWPNDAGVGLNGGGLGGVFGRLVLQIAAGRKGC